MKFNRSGLGFGTDGQPCPFGCEKVIKDQAWWNQRAAQFAEAKKVYPEAVMDAYGWFWNRYGRQVPIVEQKQPK